MRDSWASISTHLASMVVLDHHPWGWDIESETVGEGNMSPATTIPPGSPWKWSMMTTRQDSVARFISVVGWFRFLRFLWPRKPDTNWTCVFWHMCTKKSNKCINILTIFISLYTTLFQGFDNIPGEHGIPQNSQQFIKVFLSCWGSGMSGFCYVASFLKLCFHDKCTINLQIDLPNNELVSRRATKGAQWYRQCRKCTAKPAVARRKRAGESRLKKSCCFFSFNLTMTRHVFFLTYMKHVVCRHILRTALTSRLVKSLSCPMGFHVS